MSSASLSPPDPGLPHMSLGFQIANVSIQALESLFLVYQSIRFFTRTETESIWMKTLVCTLMCLSLAQTGLAIWTSQEVFAADFGDLQSILVQNSITKAQTMLTALLASTVHVFCIFRCWQLLEKKFHVLVVLGSLVGLNIAAAIKFTASIVHTNVAADLNFSPITANKRHLNPWFLLTLFLPAVLDMALAGILLTFLLRSRRPDHSHRFKSVMERLIAMAWGTALPPCLCAIAVTIIYVSWLQQNWWQSLFQAMLGKLYAMSLLATLNTRAALRKYCSSDGVDGAYTLTNISQIWQGNSVARSHPADRMNLGIPSSDAVDPNYSQQHSGTHHTRSLSAASLGTGMCPPGNDANMDVMPAGGQ